MILDSRNPLNLLFLPLQTSRLFLKKFQMVVKKIDRRSISDLGSRIKFSPTNKFSRKIPDPTNLELEMEYGMKIETQLAMKLEMNNDAARSLLENSMGIETS